MLKVFPRITVTCTELTCNLHPRVSAPTLFNIPLLIIWASVLTVIISIINLCLKIPFGFFLSSNLQLVLMPYQVLTPFVTCHIPSVWLPCCKHILIPQVLYWPHYSNTDVLHLCRSLLQFFTFFFIIENDL